MSEAVEAAVEVAGEVAHAAHGEEHDTAGYILHHVQDGYVWELPNQHGLARDIHLKAILGDWTVNVGGHAIDLTPTKLTLMMWLSAIVLVTGLLWSMRGRTQVPRGRLQGIVESLFIFVRDEIAVKNIGHDGHKFTPYLATCFFFILTMNLMGLIPYGATATGNLSVTVVFAVATFLMTQAAGMKAQGVVGYWLHLVPNGVPWWLYPLMIPVELVGLVTKPFALMMRLFANMVAGHIVIFFLLGLIFIVKALWVAPFAVGLAFAIFLLELFVAFVQAFIFTLLSSVFIGMTSHAH